MDKFLVRLRQQARHRNFDTLLDDNLKDRLIEKLDDHFRAEENIPFERH